MTAKGHGADKESFLLISRANWSSRHLLGALRAKPKPKSKPSVRHSRAFYPPDNSLPYRPLFPTSLSSLPCPPPRPSSLTAAMPCLFTSTSSCHLRSANHELASSGLPFVPFRESNLLLCIVNSEASEVGGGGALKEDCKSLSTPRNFSALDNRRNRITNLTRNIKEGRTKRISRQRPASAICTFRNLRREKSWL